MENPFRQENFKQAKINFSDFGGVFGFAMARYTIHAFSGDFLSLCRHQLWASLIPMTLSQQNCPYWAI
jgi:hypothetical protein